MEVVGTGYEFGTTTTTAHRPALRQGRHADLRRCHRLRVRALRREDPARLVGSGIKEKYVFQKMGVPFRQMHSWDNSGPYHGYDGFAIFARDMDMAINSPIWKKTKAPWNGCPAAEPDGGGMTEAEVRLFFLRRRAGDRRSNTNPTRVPR